MDERPILNAVFFASWQSRSIHNMEYKTKPMQGNTPPQFKMGRPSRVAIDNGSTLLQKILPDIEYESPLEEITDDDYGDIPTDDQIGRVTTQQRGTDQGNHGSETGCDQGEEAGQGHGPCQDHEGTAG